VSFNVHRSESIRRDMRSISTRSLTLLAAILIATPALGQSGSVDVVTLSTGESLTVEIISVSDEQVVFVHPALGTMTVPRSAVSNIVRGADPTAPAAPIVADVPAPTPTPPPATESAAPAAAAAEPAVVPDDEPDPERWKFRLTFAGDGSAGNTERANFLIRFRALRETEATRARAELSYFFASTDGDKSDSRFTTNLRHDWLMPESRWFFFVRGNYAYDEFQSWLHRLQGFGGAGYRLIEPPKFALDSLFGAGVTKEWKSDNDDPRMEGLFGLEGALDIAKDHTFVFATTFFPDFTDLGEFRWTSSAGWSWRFNSRSPLSLTAGLEHEYQSEVDAGRDRNDIRVFAGIDWDF